MNTKEFDLFEAILEEIQSVCDKWIKVEQDKGYFTYEDCKQFLLELNDHGYTFEYGLDALPFNLRKLNIEQNQLKFKKFIYE